MPRVYAQHPNKVSADKKLKKNRWSSPHRSKTPIDWYWTPAMAQFKAHDLLGALKRTPGQEQLLAIILAGKLSERETLQTLVVSCEEELEAFMMHLAVMIFSTRSRAYSCRRSAREAEGFGGPTACSLLASARYPYDLAPSHPMKSAVKYFAASIAGLGCARVIECISKVTFVLPPSKRVVTVVFNEPQIPAPPPARDTQLIEDSDCCWVDDEEYMRFSASSPLSLGSFPELSPYDNDSLDE